MSNESDNKEKNMLVGIPTSRLIDELQSRKLNQSDIDILHGLQISEDEKMRVSNIEADTAKEFVKAISGKNVFGLLAIGAKIDGGKPVSWELARGFYDHGPDKDLSMVGNDPIFKIVNGLIYRDRIPELMSKQFVTIPDFRYGVIQIDFFQDTKAIENRQFYTPARVSVKIPRETMEKFIVAIQSSPDMLEEFYQQAFPGLDSLEQGQPGFRRLKSDGFYLITGPKLIKEAYLANSGAIKLKDYFKTVPFLKYKRGPYGTGGIFQPH